VRQILDKIIALQMKALIQKISNFMQGLKSAILAMRGNDFDKNKTFPSISMKF
jgi:hypothetical protein